MIPSHYYDGLEIDMLAIGDADCILVTRWESGRATRVLIDGGCVDSVDTVRAFLFGHTIGHIDHVICSHPHDDHAAGLVELMKDLRLTFGRLWMHQPWRHINTALLYNAWGKGNARQATKILSDSITTQLNLSEVAIARQIPFDMEPLSGQRIGPLFVFGPSVEFYNALLMEFSDLNRLARYEGELDRMQREQAIEDLMEAAKIAEAPSGLLDDPQTEPENNSATILWTKYANQTFVFTSDAGTAAIKRAIQKYCIGHCHWMQIPHHGSRRNITQPLIEYFSPTFAFVSAAGNRKHPRRAVVNAFKSLGTTAFSTHHPNTANLWFRAGFVPFRVDYGSATALWEAKS